LSNGTVYAIRIWREMQYTEEKEEEEEEEEERNARERS
jgi:hypothetical protein